MDAMPNRNCRERAREEGVALMISVLVLLLVSAMAISAIEHSGEERAAGARLRSAARTLYAADAGIQIVMNRLAQSPPNPNAIDVTLSGGVSVQSRERNDTAPMDFSSEGPGPPPPGFQLNIGSGFSSAIYLANVTAVAPDGSATELETKLGTLDTGGGGY
jgi:hypothetical protein